MKVLPLGVCLSLVCSMAYSQDLPVSVSVGNAPFVFNGDESQLASITITENHPTALQDGYITLHGRLNPDQEVRFTDDTTVTGSIAGYRTSLAPSANDYVLVIEVDADDSAIDSITIEPDAFVRYDDEFYMFHNESIDLQLEDGRPYLADGTPPAPGAGIGDAANYYALGTFGGSGDVTIGDASSLEMTVGETTTVAINGGEPTHPGDVRVESFDPGVVSIASHTLAEVELTANAPGEALVQTWDPAGNSGYLSVTVTNDDSNGGNGDEDDNSSNGGDSEASGRSNLPAAAMEGGSVEASFQGIATAADGGAQPFTTADQLRVAGEIAPAPSHVGQPAELFVAIHLSSAAGANNWFYQNQSGQFLPWNGQITSLQPARLISNLQASEEVTVHEGALMAGEYQVYFAYMTQGGNFIYSSQPLHVQISE